MGTPDFAVPTLRRLAAWPHGALVAVYTQPDRPAGRGHRLAMPAVKQAALELGLPVEQPENFKDPAAVARLGAYAPDVLVVAAYGLLLPQAVLDLPRLAPLNVHASLLPRWRGAAPIQRAVMEDWQPGARTGVSIMRVVRQLDAGPVYARASLPLDDHTAGSLHDALARMGAELLPQVLDALLEGRAAAEEQDADSVTYAAKITREDSCIDWSRPAVQVHAHIRGVTPWPGARVALRFDGQDKTFPCTVAPGAPGAACPGAAPGTLAYADEQLRVACADRWYALGPLRPQGRKSMSARDFVNGALRGLRPGPCGHAAAE
ncbi:methionyl-tRNA formyltransferase [Desulfovibrio legallii]|uniref:Methionyl-tRNA formyltransferase n=2 Tax=Desulfovibrio legallii TaxID=571438 RepID=A0A1G7Q4H4_9BACT|nr:methionyl-tRNA formyltransferase [Desulfovibrio legallii]